MNKLTILCLSLVIALSIGCKQEKEFTCKIIGETVNRNSDSIYLFKATESWSNANIVIPIVENKFEYEFTSKQEEAYKLIFGDEYGSAWREITFFAEEGEVYLKLFPLNEFHKNELSGGGLNNLYSRYLKEQYDLFDSKIYDEYAKMRRLEDSNELYNPEYLRLLKILGKTIEPEKRDSIFSLIVPLMDSGNDKSDKGKVHAKNIREIEKNNREWKVKYIKENVSLVSYYLIVEDILETDKWDGQVMDRISFQLSIYEDEFPNHIYKELIPIFMDKRKLKESKKYLDFSAPNNDGERIQLSDIVSNNKIVLLDLWTVSCGPCLRKAKSMIPIYQEYKEKGFEVLGVTRDNKTQEELQSIVEKYNFPWLTLYESFDENKLWKRYDIGDGGGCTFLIDQEGNILAFDPDADEVRKILEGIL